jgi:redox-regulated HSP33 family molecular chaperone
LTKDDKVSVTCEFCSERYEVGRQEAEELFLSSL